MDFLKNLDFLKSFLSLKDLKMMKEIKKGFLNLKEKMTVIQMKKD